jgi:hypothetical protein
VCAWLEAELGREPDRDVDGLVEACLRAIGLPDDAGAEVFVELDALLDPGDAAEEDAIAASLAAPLLHRRGHPPGDRCKTLARATGASGIVTPAQFC